MYAEESEVFSIGGCCGDDAYAFGFCDDAWVSCHDLDFILHYEDGYWVKMAVLDDYVCQNVWSISKNDVYMTCTGGLVLHYNGTDWLETKLPSSQEYVALRGIWGDGNGNVFIVGHQSDASANGVVTDYIAQFIANQWHEISTGEECRLKKVWGTSASNVFAVGECGVIRYDGTEWKKVEVGASGWVSDIWGTRESSVYAVSDLIYHYDGNDWTAMDPDPDVFGFSKIDGTSDDNIYGIGLRHVLHYDGARWRDVSPKGDYILNDIWVSPGGDVYVVGYLYDPDVEISYSDGVIFKHICEVK